MKRPLKIAACAICGLLILACYLSCAKFPKQWSAIHIGSKIHEVSRSLPTIRPDAKDGGQGTWYSGQTTTRPLFVSFTWHIDIDTDRGGTVLRFNGRSYNDVSGVFDIEFQEPRDL